MEQLINENKFMSAITILFLNIGAKYIGGDLTKLQESLFMNQYFKKIVLLSMFFVSTRDITISLLLTIVYTVFIDFLFNENSKYCILPNKITNKNNINFNNYIENIKKSYHQV